MTELSFGDMVLRLGPSMYAAEVKVRGNTRPEPLTEHISHMSGVVNVAAL